MSSDDTVEEKSSDDMKLVDVYSTNSNNRKEVNIKLPYPVLSDHRDPSSVLTLLQTETQGTSKKILDITKLIEELEKKLSSKHVSENTKKPLKYERIRRKQQLDALKKHERRVNLQIDYITTKIEIQGLEEKRSQNIDDNNNNQQIDILLRKLKQKLDQMKVYMRTRNEQMKKHAQDKQQTSPKLNDSRPNLSTSHKLQQHLNSSDLNRKRSSSNTNISHGNKRLKQPVVRLTNRQSQNLQTPTVRFLNKTTTSTMSTLNSSSPTTPASSSSTLSPPLIATTSTDHTTNDHESLSKQINLSSMDDDDEEIDTELNIDELFNDDPYAEETL